MKPMKIGQTAGMSSGYSHHQQNFTPPPVEQKKKFEIAGTEFIVDAKYDVIKQIGSGAYGVVVSAVDRTTGSKYAIKKVKSLNILGCKCFR